MVEMSGMTKQQHIPGRVLLCAIGYTVTAREGMVLFSAEPGVAGCFTRLAFTRQAGCWYVEIHSSCGTAMVSHIVAAQKMVNEWFGGNHDSPRGDYVP